jgi:activator of HSP90 ATPase
MCALERSDMKFTVSDVIPASPQAIYDAWLDSRGHGKMTGAKAKASTKVGGDFSASDGYATGKNLELEPGKRIVQSWRTTDFAASDPDSKITITLAPAGSGTKITLLHTRVPDGHEEVKVGWRDYYFEPMKEYFGKHHP